MPGEIPAFPATGVEAICRELAECATGTQITNLIAGLKVRETPAEQTATKWKRLFNAVAQKQNQQHDGRPLIRLVTEMMAPVRFGSRPSTMHTVPP